MALGLLDWCVRTAYPQAMEPLQWFADRSPVTLTDVACATGVFAGIWCVRSRARIASWIRSHRLGSLTIAASAFLYGATATAPYLRTFNDPVLHNPPRIERLEDRVAAIETSLALLSDGTDPSPQPADPVEIQRAITRFLSSIDEPTIPARGVIRTSLVIDAAHRLRLTWGFTNPALLWRESAVPIPFDTIFAPYTIAHELAHQQGFGTEAAAQFVAYAALMTSDNPRWRVSATLERLLRETEAVTAAGSTIPNIWEYLPRQVAIDYLRSIGTPVPGIGTRLQRVGDFTYDVLLAATDQGNSKTAYGSRFLDLVHAWERSQVASAK